MADDVASSKDGSGWAAPPSWDGDPSRFRTYQQEVWLWYDTLAPSSAFSVGARLVRGLTGVARKTGRCLDRERLRGTPAVAATEAVGEEGSNDYVPATPGVRADPVQAFSISSRSSAS